MKRIQGEGDYESAAVYQRKATRFARGADTEELAREAAPRDAGEAQAMEEAERRGRERSKGEDPGPPKERNTLRLKKKKT